MQKLRLPQSPPDPTACTVPRNLKLTLLSGWIRAGFQQREPCLSGSQRDLCALFSVLPIDENLSLEDRSPHPSPQDPQPGSCPAPVRPALCLAGLHAQLPHLHLPTPPQASKGCPPSRLVVTVAHLAIPNGHGEPLERQA
ncbi:hypothetical protein P7K49_006027 [Saguinus oedipus]|uniref:Uncharacterized protein n=1 Tax=Saguinus oedipus TaxID=9490 RepID=A0ABQ9W206_SAGOE|nr:hypothetical protein P7K49_006027 [Saguinus oedipus]